MIEKEELKRIIEKAVANNTSLKKRIENIEYEIKPGIIDIMTTYYDPYEKIYDVKDHRRIEFKYVHSHGKVIIDINDIYKDLKKAFKEINLIKR